VVVSDLIARVADLVTIVVMSVVIILCEDFKEGESEYTVKVTLHIGWIEQSAGAGVNAEIRSI